MALIRTFVGGGGKTSTILEEMTRYQKKGLRVVVTTSTHMRLPRLVPEGTDRLTENLDQAEYLLDQGQIVWYGHPVKGKPCFTLTEGREWESLKRMADVILVEGDGANRLPVKTPDLTREPVILSGSQEIVVVFGMSGLGKEIGENCFRIPLMLKLLNREREGGFREESILDVDLYTRLIHEGYLQPLRKNYPLQTLSLYLNQVTGEERRKAGEMIAEQIHSLPGWEALTIAMTNYDRAVSGGLNENRHQKT